MAITPLPTPPRRDHPESFADDGDVFLGALPTFGTEINALAAEINAASSDALAQAEAALAAVNCPAWVSGTTYTVGQCVYSPITHYSYRRKIAGAGTTDPSADATNWQKLNSGIASVKTINGTSLEGTGDIVIDSIPFGAF